MANWCCLPSPIGDEKISDVFWKTISLHSNRFSYQIPAKIVLLHLSIIRKHWWFGREKCCAYKLCCSSIIMMQRLTLGKQCFSMDICISYQIHQTFKLFQILPQCCSYNSLLLQILRRAVDCTYWCPLITNGTDWNNNAAGQMSWTKGLCQEAASVKMFARVGGGMWLG